ncbi:FAD-dependent oxidoreductase [Devosia sp.]|uniref:electron transfer flavoprotein-ubiquinone oxidoreductase n=1 Tax=Devosia sp. TaxID=1871048 RepID=UPI003A90D1D4
MTDAGNRDLIETDVVIVGAGPAGLSAAIRLKQRHSELSVTVVEKSAELGGHILSGAVMDPAGLDMLLPDWRDRAPLGPKVTRDRFHLLGPAGAVTLPNLLIPPQMRSHDAHIISLGALVRWLGEEAQALGVDIFPMTAAVDVLTGAEGQVEGIITGDLGLDAEGEPKPGVHAAGIALKAKYTLIGEGARGSLAKQLVAGFGLDAGRDPQLYGLGIKEIWEIDPARHHPGQVDHYLGYPLDNATSGGGFVYHAADNRVYVGFVTHLSYENPTLSPFGEFQRFKQHPAIADLLAGGRRISYGARALTSGGLQSVPALAFPGGALIGCAAGFMNVPGLKAIHNAMRSAIAAADEIGAAIADGRAHDTLAQLEAAVLATGIGAELKAVRNVKPLWARFGTALGVVLAGIDMWSLAILRLSPFGTLHHKAADFARLKPIDQVRAKTYPRPDGELTYDRAASVFLANLSHDEDQPVHLKLGDPDLPIRENLPRYGEPAPLYCPAGVYEVAEAGGAPVFRIHAANCVHCKTCDIKDPAQNITWVPPEGGSGPNYSGM